MGVRVLGPVALSSPAGLVAPGGRQLASLLALLVVRAPQEARSDWLLDALWGAPRSPAALRVLVLRLRRVLADAGLGDLVITGAGGYRLALAPEDVDAGRAEALVAAAREARGEGDAARAVELLRTAGGLWRGEPFADVADLEALRPHVERLTTLRLDALEHEAACLVELGEHEAAAAMLRTLARAHPLREHFTGLLMIALARAGRPAESLRAYTELRDRLDDELGVDPCDELQRLERELLVPGSDPGAAELVLRAGVPARADVPSPPRIPGVLRSLRDGALVGRDGELAMLAGEVLVPGRGGLAVLTGEPGIGKTRLAAELAHRAAGAGMAVVYASCSPSGGGGQEPIADLVRQLADLAPPQHRADLLRLGTDEPAGVDLATGAALRRSHLEGVVHRAVEALGRHGALVVLDDVHWVHPGVGHFLTVLVQERVAGVGWLVLARSTEATPDGGDLLASLARSGAVVMDLAPLADDAVEAIGRQHLPASDQADRLAPEVAARAGGNPLYAVELARYLRGGGDPAAAPPDLRSMVRRQLDRLGPEPRRLAQLLALGGPTYPLPAAARVAGLDDIRAAEAADSLVAARVLTSWAARGGAFRHPVIAQAVADDVGPALTERLRAELGAALDPADTDTAVLRADLLLAARAVVAPGEVQRAVDAAIRRLLMGGWYEAAVALGRSYLDLVPPGQRILAEEVTARLSVATAFLAAGATNDGVRLLDEAATAADVLGRPELQADAILARGPLGARRLPGAELDRMVALVDLVDPADASRRIQLLCWAAHHLLVIGDAHRASELVDRATALLAEEPSVTMRVLVLGMRFQLDAGVWSTPARAATSYDAVARLAATTDYLPAHLMAQLFGLTQALRQSGLDVFHARIDELRRGTARIPRPDLVWWVEAASAGEALARGELDLAATRIDEADQVGRRLHVVHARPIGMLHQLLLQWEEGRLGDLAPLLRPGDDGSQQLAWLAAALAWVAAGDAGGAADAVARSGRPTLAGTGEQWPYVAMLAASVCGPAGDAAWAAALADELAAHRGTALSVHGLAYLGSVDAHLGRLLLATGQVDAAVPLLSSGAGEEQRWGAPRWAARSLADAATALRGRGDPGDEDRAEELDRRAAGLGDTALHQRR